MNAMINLKASRKTPTINVGVNPVTNVHVTNRGTEGSPTMVHYPPLPNEQPNSGENLPRLSPMGIPNGLVLGASSPENGEFVSVAPQTAMSTFTETPIVDDDPEKAKLLRENAVLKLIIDIQQSNPLIVNKYIVADDALLMQMVALLCNATEVNIDADDIGRGCLSKNTYRKVHSIYVTVDGQTKNLKYDFSDVMKTLKDLHISVKYVY